MQGRDGIPAKRSRALAYEVPDDVQEACGQLLDLWQGVEGFRALTPYRYPLGVWALWLRLEAPNPAAPEEWMGVPVVVFTGGQPEPEPIVVRMNSTVEMAERISDVLLRAPKDVVDRLADQLWLRSVLIEQRRRTRIAERDTFDARADRILELLDPQEPEGAEL